MAEPVVTQDLRTLDPQSVPLDQIDLSRAELHQADAHWGYFARLRREDPVHYCPESAFGPFWSVTKYHDIMQVEKSHDIFSSEWGIALGDRPADFQTTNFIGMDPPKHDDQRKAVQGVVAPRNLKEMEGLIRSRVQGILDGLPRGETFNWVDEVSIELTTQMLATLFDYPFERRRDLTHWSDVSTASAQFGGSIDEEYRRAELLKCLQTFKALREERVDKTGFDLITMLANDTSTQDMPDMEYLGNLLLLIVGGNDTTRNSITGGVLALNRFPQEYDKLRNDHGLIPNMVSEIIRWQTPLAYMRRTVLKDTVLRDKQLRKGDKVVMWYVSGNRDEEVIERGDEFIIDRPNARSHMSFGFGVHRCMGNRLAEMQLRVLWEEIMQRFERIEVVGEPVRVESNFVRGYSELPVRLSNS